VEVREKKDKEGSEKDERGVGEGEGGGDRRR